MEYKFSAIIFAIIIAGLAMASGATSFSGSTYSASYVTPDIQPDFQTYYSQSDLTTYWPILQEEKQCEGRQDFVLQVAPAGCQPVVVRSDLLAEQNVPVFCQIDALQSNPLINVKEIKNIHFSGQYPDSVVTTGFYPARAALRTRDTLLGSPLVNNIGYVVVVLKKNPIEKNLTDFITVNLTGELEYESGNAFGIGRTEFLMQKVSDENWNKERSRYSFWHGNYYVRLDDADATRVLLSLYYGDKKVGSITAEAGKTSRTVYLPGMYCQAGIEAQYGGFVSGVTTARIEVSGDLGIDTYSVGAGSKFDNDRCSVQSVTPSTDLPGQGFGSAQINCAGSGSVILTLKPRAEYTMGNFVTKSGTTYPEQYKDASGNPVFFIIDFTGEQNAPPTASGAKGGVYGIDLNNNFYYLGASKADIGKAEKIVIINANGVLQDAFKGSPDSQKFYTGTREGLVNYRNYISSAGENAKGVLFDTPLPDASAEKEFNEMISAYEKVAADYQGERATDVSGAEYYGEVALQRALAVAENPSIVQYKPETRARLLGKLIEGYPSSKIIDEYKKKLDKLVRTDDSSATAVLKVNGRYKTISLAGVDDLAKKSTATFRANIAPVQIEEGGSTKSLGGATSIKVEKVVSPEQVDASVYCDKYNAFGGVTTERAPNAPGIVRISINDAAKEYCIGEVVKLESIDLSQVAKIVLVPKASGTGTKTNVTVKIGIEKRGIKLSPDKTKEMIKNINESILRWQSMSDKLTKVVTGLKATCFATSLVLIAKSFVTGLDGTTIARQQAMEGPNGWTERCKSMVESGKYSSITLCLNDNKGVVDSEIESRRNVIKEMNGVIKNEVEKGLVTDGGLFGDDTVNTQAAAENMKKKIIDDFGASRPDIKQMLEAGSPDSKGRTSYTYGELKDLYFNLKLQQENPNLQSISDKSINSITNSLTKMQTDLSQRQQSEAQKGNLGRFASSPNLPTSKVEAPFFTIKDGKLGESVMTGGAIDFSGLEGKTAVGLRGTSGTTTTTGGLVVPGTTKDYLFIGGYDKFGRFQPEKVYEYSETGGVATLTVPPKGVGEYGSVMLDNKVAAFDNIDRTTKYSTPIDPSSSSTKVRFFGPGPFEGLPAQVPFEVQGGQGYYAKVEARIGGQGQQASYDSSGLPRIWKICNVGSDGIIDSNDDFTIVDSMSPPSTVLGQKEDLSRRLIQQSRDALLAAAGQSKQKEVQIGTKKYEVDKNPVALTDPTQCQNFMSISDCRVLFNVCDPVICPTSRCDLGGAYRVDDVIQSGIIGGTLLCLPNIKEPIFIPFCLTGIQAGMDGWISVLKNHRDCLQNSLDTGQMVGICDEIYSVYKCKFFWEQVAPFVNAIIPKIIGMAYGQTGARGGGEYKNVQSAWENVRKSTNYFTQSYAANTFKVFQSRSIEQIGFEFCQGSISAVLPKGFKSLVEPESPVQFHAWFDVVKYSDATVPPTSQYKVFYHIYAGKNAGVTYSVYLKSPPESSYYASTPRVQVATGFITAGDYKSETKDFTAPEGYKELCVMINEKEECGFKQVSTSFAVNYARDLYVKSKMGEANITTENECMSGTRSVSSVLGSIVTNINPQSMFEEAAMPQDYMRGIVRICSTVNPGASTEPGRYVERGYCGDPKVICWLDKNSVDNAMTEGNIGLKNATMQELEGYQQAMLEKQGYLTGANANAQLDALANNLSTVVDIKTRNDFLQKSAMLALRLAMNHQKARLLVMNGDAFRNAFLNMYLKKGEEKISQKLKPLTAEQLLTAQYPDKMTITIGERVYEISLITTDATKAYYSINVANPIAGGMSGLVCEVSRSTVAGQPYVVGKLYEYSSANPPYFKGRELVWETDAFGLKEAFTAKLIEGAQALPQVVTQLNIIFSLENSYVPTSTAANRMKLGDKTSKLYVIYNGKESVIKYNDIWADTPVARVDEKQNWKIVPLSTSNAQTLVDQAFGGQGYYQALMNNLCLVPGFKVINTCTEISAPPVAGEIALTLDKDYALKKPGDTFKILISGAETGLLINSSGAISLFGMEVGSVDSDNRITVMGGIDDQTMQRQDGDQIAMYLDGATIVNKKIVRASGTPPLPTTTIPRDYQADYLLSLYSLKGSEPIVDVSLQISLAGKASGVYVHKSSIIVIDRPGSYRTIGRVVHYTSQKTGVFSRILLLPDAMKLLSLLSSQDAAKMYRILQNATIKGKLIIPSSGEISEIDLYPAELSLQHTQTEKYIFRRDKIVTGGASAYEKQGYVDYKVYNSFFAGEELTFPIGFVELFPTANRDDVVSSYLYDYDDVKRQKVETVLPYEYWTKEDKQKFDAAYSLARKDILSIGGTTLLSDSPMLWAGQRVYSVKKISETRSDIYVNNEFTGIFVQKEPEGVISVRKEDAKLKNPIIGYVGVVDSIINLNSNYADYILTADYNSLNGKKLGATEILSAGASVVAPFTYTTSAEVDKTWDQTLDQIVSFICFLEPSSAGGALTFDAVTAAVAGYSVETAVEGSAVTLTTAGELPVTIGRVVNVGGKAYVFSIENGGIIAEISGKTIVPLSDVSKTILVRTTTSSLSSTALGSLGGAAPAAGQSLKVVPMGAELVKDLGFAQGTKFALTSASSQTSLSDPAVKLLQGLSKEASVAPEIVVADGAVVQTIQTGRGLVNIGRIVEIGGKSLVVNTEAGVVVGELSGAAVRPLSAETIQLLQRGTASLSETTVELLGSAARGGAINYGTLSEEVAAGYKLAQGTKFVTRITPQMLEGLSAAEAAKVTASAGQAVATVTEGGTLTSELGTAIKVGGRLKWISRLSPYFKVAAKVGDGLLLYQLGCAGLEVTHAFIDLQESVEEARLGVEQTDAKWTDMVTKVDRAIASYDKKGEIMANSIVANKGLFDAVLYNDLVQRIEKYRLYVAIAKSIPGYPTLAKQHQALRENLDVSSSGMWWWKVTDQITNDEGVILLRNVRTMRIYGRMANDQLTVIEQKVLRSKGLAVGTQLEYSALTDLSRQMDNLGPILNETSYPWLEYGTERVSFRYDYWVKWTWRLFGKDTRATVAEITDTNGNTLPKSSQQIASDLRGKSYSAGLDYFINKINAAYDAAPKPVTVTLPYIFVRGGGMYNVLTESGGRIALRDKAGNTKFRYSYLSDGWHMDVVGGSGGQVCTGYPDIKDSETLLPYRLTWLLCNVADRGMNKQKGQVILFSSDVANTRGDWSYLFK